MQQKFYFKTLYTNKSMYYLSFIWKDFEIKKKCYVELHFRAMKTKIYLFGTDRKQWVCNHTATYVIPNVQVKPLNVQMAVSCHWTVSRDCVNLYFIHILDQNIFIWFYHAIKWVILNLLISIQMYLNFLKLLMCIFLIFNA